MKKLLRIVKRILFVCAAGAVALTALTAFAAVYGFSGIHVKNPSGATDYKWEPGQLKTNMTEGFSWLCVDKYGFNNPDGGSAVNPDVLIMGSSHMEAVNVPKDSGAAAVLSSLLPEYSVYNIGVSGHDIYRCAKNAAAAVNEYGPRRFVVIETSTVSLSNGKMKEVLDGKLSAIPSYDRGALYLLQKYCPAVKTLYKQADDWKNAGAAPKPARSEAAGGGMDPEILDSFLKSIRDVMPDGCKLIIVFHPETELDADGGMTVKTNADDLEAFRNACENNGVIFADTTDAAVALYNERHILIHGFINTSVGKGHLNRYGHRIIAECLADVIREDGR